MNDKPQTRAAEVQATRRRRQDTGENAGMKLHVPEAAKDPNFTYRWFNDEPGRIHAKTVMDDWDLVGTDQMNGLAEPEKQAEQGTRVARFGEKGATGANGQPRKVFLARKRKELHTQDEAEKQARINAKEESLRRGAPADPKALSGSTAYVPGGVNIVNGR